MRVLLGDRIILMPVSSNKSAPHAKAPTVPTSVFVMLPATKSALCPTAILDRRDMKGTVDAAMEPIEAHSYSLAGERVILASSCRPAGVSRPDGQPKSPARPRAIDLISELQEISGQVNRMMAQVERAIDRLVVHTG